MEYGRWRDLIRRLIVGGSHHEEVVSIRLDDLRRVRWGIYKAARLAKVSIVIFQGIEDLRVLKVRLKGFGSSWITPPGSKSKLRDPVGRAAYAVAEKKGLPCTISPDEVKAYLAKN
jgi:hypothetical protein